MLIEAYVDGSWMDGKVGWGAIILKDGLLHAEFSGVLDEDEVHGTRQVAGELKAVEAVLLWCKEQSVKHITIHYDYTGIKEWAVGSWKAKNKVTQAYKDFVQSVAVAVKWVKVKSHSGNKYNDMVDKLAKKMIS